MSGVEITQAELLLCPFCGGDPITEFACTPDGDGAYFVHCQHDSCPAWPNTQGETEAEANAAWNTRQSATTEALAAMEQAREALELAEGLHSWLAHRFGVKGPEYAEVAARSKKTAAALTRITAELAKHKGNSDEQG